MEYGSSAPGALPAPAPRTPWSAILTSFGAPTVAEVGCPLSLTYGAQLDAPVSGLGWDC